MTQVGLYNRWLSTLGGGEKESLSIAERISQYAPVEVISHKVVDKEYAAERLDLDLSRVNFISIPDCSGQALPLITQKYDLFINASHLDYFPSMARHSASLIFFPTPLNYRIAFRRGVKRLLRRWFALPEMIAGVNRFELSGDTIRWYSEAVLQVQLPASAVDYQVTFNVQRLDKRVREIQVLLDRQIVVEIRIDGDSPVACNFLVNGERSDQKREMIVKVCGVDEAVGEPKMVVSDVNLSLPNHIIFQQLFKTQLTGKVAYMLNFYPPAYSIVEYLKTYDAVWACSDYSRRWIKKYWNFDSEVLYPPVNIESFYAAPKRKQILNVGRFFAGQHNKKHLELVHAFRDMVDNGLSGWELHLAGGVAKGEEYRAYYETVREAAQGYPILFHPNAPIDELQKLYAESAIYWHASGYGEDEKAHPEKFEHFGITTVEAMASGCCPVVIGKGGQPEIVSHGVNGFLWNNMEELQSFTRMLIADETLRARIAKAAQEASRRFSQERFNDQIDQFLKRIDFIS